MFFFFSVEPACKKLEVKPKKVTGGWQHIVKTGGGANTVFTACTYT
jgi:hypothetical protein